MNSSRDKIDSTSRLEHVIISFKFSHLHIHKSNIVSQNNSLNVNKARIAVNFLTLHSCFLEVILCSEFVENL